jgi:hypothetical protein
VVEVGGRKATMVLKDPHSLSYVELTFDVQSFVDDNFSVLLRNRLNMNVNVCLHALSVVILIQGPHAHVVAEMYRPEVFRQRQRSGVGDKMQSTGLVGNNARQNR